MALLLTIRELVQEPGVDVLSWGANISPQTSPETGPEVVTAGESMVLGVPPQPGRLRHAPSLELRTGGAESNLAIALSRLGHTVGWVSRLGADEPGQLVLNRIRAEGVDTSRVGLDKHLPTGLYLRENLHGDTRAYYYRRGSAASGMAPGEVDLGYLDGARALHLTGVTPALSESCAEFVLWAAGEARSRGIKVSYDINYRSKLWSAGEALRFTEKVIPTVDLLFIGDEEAYALWGREDDKLPRELSALGPAEVVLKKGAQGSMAYVAGEYLHQEAFPVTELDPIGAGDAFAAGYLAGELMRADPDERLRLASALGAYSVMTVGDYEGLPDADELDAFLSGERRLGR